MNASVPPADPAEERTSLPAEDELLRHRAAVLDLVPDAVMTSDPATSELLYVNDSACRLLGYTRDELLGMHSSQLRPELSAEERRALVANLSAHPGLTYRLTDVTLRSRDGDRIDCESHSAVITVDGGRQVVVSVVRDVRERLALVDRLRRSEASFRTVFEEAPVGALVATLEADGRRRLVRANAALARTLGEPVEALVGEDLSRFADARDVDEGVAALASVARGSSPAESGVWRYRAADGSSRWLDLRMVPVQLPDLPGPLVLAYLADVSERQEALERLAVSDASFRTVFDRSPIAAVVARLDGERPQVVRANRAAVRLFGESAEVLDDVLDDTVVTGVARGPAADGTPGYPAVRRCRRGDGSVVWAEVHAVALQLPDLPGPLALVHLVDVTERRTREVRQAQTAAIDQLIAQVVTAVLADQGLPDTYQQVADGVADVFGARDVAIVLPDAATGIFDLVAAHGPLARALMRAGLPVPQDVVAWLTGRSSQGLIVPAVVPGLAPGRAARLGPVIATRFEAPPGGEGGVLMAARVRGEEPFSGEEADHLTSMAQQLTLAIRLGRTRSEQRRQVAERDAYLARLEDGLRTLSDARQVQATACRLLGEHLHASRVLYVDIEDEQLAVVRQEYLDGVPSIAGRQVLSPGLFAESARGDGAVVMDDASADPRLDPADRSRFRSRSAAGGIAAPLVKDGRLIAALAVHSAQPRRWTELEVQLTRDTAERTWAAVQRAAAELASAEERRRREAVERELVEQAARDQRERLEQEFITNAAHELRTPLTGILAAVDALEAGAADDAVARRRFLTHLRRESARMARLSDSLLLLAQAQSLGPPPSEPFGVADLLRSVAADLHPAEAVAVVVDADPALTLQAHPGLVEVVVGNLAANAIACTAVGEVRLSARTEGPATVVEVCDTGPGMDESTVERARDRFYRHASSRDGRGFGLGLSIAAQAAAAMGATLDVRSVPGDGTCAAVRFPGGSGRPGARPERDGHDPTVRR